MGEKKEGAKNESEKKAGADAGAKKDDGMTTVVLKLDMHCEGCAKKVKRAVRSFDGVGDVKADCATSKLTVNGKVDPAALREKLEQKIKKKVELVSPQPKKDGGGGDKKTEEKPEKKPEEKKPSADDKKPKEVTVVLKIRLHCEGCIQKIRKIISKSKGVESVKIDDTKDLVTVKGTMDVKELVPYLSVKLKRSVEVVPPKKDEGAGGGEKKDKEGGGDKKDAGGDKKADKKDGAGGEKKEGGGDKKEGGGDKKEGGGDKKEGGGGAAKMEVNKMEYFGYPSHQPSMFWYDAPTLHSHNNYVMEAHAHQAHVSQAYTHQAYPGYGSMVPGHQYDAPQMFSDENPNACSVM
ncbi:heavy metal-associated isoprenylated plant protein 6 [Ziziphus jujuba]|uniref:Heavy metal-associated isoprenylated plant protein 6 n=1 Tax=Ziziphus jujuba TaxID=326968 RepID=A0A6P4AKV9_ZIZJJ|nr:heavy metal-associated isoprenylated plant protein 6 [Ziziphus jujuba]